VLFRSVLPRSLAYLRQLEAAEIEKAWSRVRCPVLVMHGEHDWVVGEEEQAALVEIVRGQPGGSASLVPIATADHLGTSQPSRAASLADYGRPPFCASIAEETVRFVRSLVGNDVVQHD
jgi:pimeloyl-ACP methyl ester carboxylesterase